MGIIIEIVDSFFKKNGLLSETIPDFEYRESQHDMAINIAKMFEDGGTYIIESATGTGKTFAYLIPAIISQQRVIISTKNKNLQEQLFFKDLSELNKFFNSGINLSSCFCEIFLTKKPCMKCLSTSLRIFSSTLFCKKPRFFCSFWTLFSRLCFVWAIYWVMVC